MNKDQMRKNVGVRVRLVPNACRLDQYGFELPAIDDEWVIQQVSGSGVTISNPRTGHVRTLTDDHIYKFTCDEARNGVRRGFLTLHVQVFIQGNEVRVLPNTRPGERVPVKRPEVVEKVVSIGYPTRSGLQGALRLQGYELRWARADNVAERVDVQGYELVIAPDPQGTLATFRTRDRLVLLKRRTTATVPS